MKSYDGLTVPQKKYLLKAYEIQGGSMWQIFFSLHVPGNTHTGRALFRKGYIETCNPSYNFPFHLSEDGFRIAEDLWRDRKEIAK